MARVADGRSVPCWTEWLFVLVGAFLTTVGGGCVSNVIKPADLPSELAATSVADVKNIRLVGLADSAVSNETIDRGDVLGVSIVTNQGNVEFDAIPTRVNEHGMAVVPLVGPVAVAGLELEDAERVIRSVAAQKAFRDPHVTVTIKRQRMNQITVIGAVETPGVYPLPRGGSNILAAFVAAGGLTESAGAEVIIRRPGQRTVTPGSSDPRAPRVASYEATQASYITPVTSAPQTIFVNLVQATRDGTGNNFLNDGDVVEVVERPLRRIRILGLVNKPSEYEIPPNEDITLLDALAMAGGRKSQLADKAYVIRQIPNQTEPAKIQISIRQAKNDGESNILLAGGDIVTVEETSVTFAMDALARFVRIGLSSSLPMF